GRHVGHELVLVPGVAGDVVAGLHDLRDRVGIKLSAAPVDAEGAADAVFAEQVDEPIDADLAAIAPPGDAGVIDHTLLHRASLHGVRRRLALAPGLQHGGDGDRDSLAVRPLVVAAHERVSLAAPTPAHGTGRHCVFA